MPAVLYELCQEELSHIASEVKRSVEYFVAQFSGARVDRGLLFGGGANLKGLPDFLHDRTGLEVQVGDPFVSVNTNNGDLEGRLGGNWASFAVALGLALRRG
jgi:type IV pilus assembly protein PilM